MKNVVAICACPMGVAHTYMAADAIEEAARKCRCSVKVETQGAGGIENKLSKTDIVKADLILIAAGVKVARSERLEGHEKKVVKVDLKTAINKADELIEPLFREE